MTFKFVDHITHFRWLLVGSQRRNTFINGYKPYLFKSLLSLFLHEFSKIVRFPWNLNILFNFMQYFCLLSLLFFLLENGLHILDVSISRSAFLRALFYIEGWRFGVWAGTLDVERLQIGIMVWLQGKTALFGWKFLNVGSFWSGVYERGVLRVESISLLMLLTGV